MLEINAFNIKFHFYRLTLFFGKNYLSLVFTCDPNVTLFACSKFPFQTLIKRIPPNIFKAECSIFLYNIILNFDLHLLEFFNIF